MKKLTFALLTVLLCIPMLATLIVPVVADDFSANLVAHYDFEGATPEEQLKDKATGGSNSDDLKINNGTPTIANGIYTKTDAAKKGEQALITDEATFLEKSDLKAVGGEHTWMIRFKINEGAVTEKLNILVDCRNFASSAEGDVQNRAFVIWYNHSDKNIEFSINKNNGASSTSVKMDIPAEAYKDGDKSKGLNYDLWWNLVVTVDELEGNEWVGTIYYAFGNPVQTGYILGKTGTLFTGTRMEISNSGNYTRFLSETAKNAISLDDVKFYNVVLTAANIATVTGAKVTDPSAETTAPETNTTAPEKETTAPEKETTAPEKNTEAATTQKPADSTSTDKTPADDNGGCSSSVAAVSLIALVAVGAGFVVGKKKKF